MRTFKSIGKGICKICNTSKDGECVLIPIDGTVDDGIEEALPFHLECLELRYSQEAMIIYMTKKSMVERAMIEE